MSVASNTTSGYSINASKLMASTPAPSLDECNHLIIVCCHAIYNGGPNHGASEDEWSVQSRWYQHLNYINSPSVEYRIIEPFQGGETPTFVKHLKAGLNALQNDTRSVLVLSG